MEGPSALCDVIERNRQLAEDTARLAPEVLEAAGRAGLWMLGAPSDAGGLEATLRRAVVGTGDLGLRRAERADRT